VWALDVTQKTFPDDPRIKFIHNDIRNYTVPEGTKDDDFGLIVDDGSHNLEDILTGWRILNKYCRRGFYVVEDVSREICMDVFRELTGSSSVVSIIQCNGNGGDIAIVASFGKVIKWA
jgi:hypothetical protein